jgi:hypothetical protein
VTAAAVRKLQRFLYNILATHGYTILITNVWNDPAKSPNLYPMDFYLQILTKRILYGATLNDVEKLKQMIDAS